VANLYFRYRATPLSDDICSTEVPFLENEGIADEISSLSYIDVRYDNFRFNSRLVNLISGIALGYVIGHRRDTIKMLEFENSDVVIGIQFIVRYAY
jgi:hypothetical protein